jgi:hypothetical protein
MAHPHWTLFEVIDEDLREFSRQVECDPSNFYFGSFYRSARKSMWSENCFANGWYNAFRSTEYGSLSATHEAAISESLGGKDHHSSHGAGDSSLAKKIKIPIGGKNINRSNASVANTSLTPICKTY